MGGGGWGGPADAIYQMEDPVNKCELAEGPFPQGTGSLTCMSRALARKGGGGPAAHAPRGGWRRVGGRTGAQLRA